MKATMLLNYKNGTIDAVANLGETLEVGDRIKTGQNDQGDIMSEVIEVLEKRKEKGIYLDESHRRDWYKLKIA